MTSKSAKGFQSVRVLCQGAEAELNILGSPMALVFGQASSFSLASCQTQLKMIEWWWQAFQCEFKSSLPWYWFDSIMPSQPLLLTTTPVGLLGCQICSPAWIPPSLTTCHVMSQFLHWSGVHVSESLNSGLEFEVALVKQLLHWSGVHVSQWHFLNNPYLSIS